METVFGLEGTISHFCFCYTRFLDGGHILLNLSRCYGQSVSFPPNIHIVMLFIFHSIARSWTIPESKVPGANLGPTWDLSAPDGPHVGPRNLAVKDGVACVSCYVLIILSNCCFTVIPWNDFMVLSTSYRCLVNKKCCIEMEFYNHALRNVSYIRIILLSNKY